MRKDSELSYVNSILSLRKEWLNHPGGREEQKKVLDQLILEALKITIELPEKLASYVLKVHESDFTNRIGRRGIHSAPMNYFFEAPVNNSEELIRLVQEERPFFNLARLKLTFSLSNVVPLISSLPGIMPC